MIVSVSLYFSEARPGIGTDQKKLYDLVTMNCLFRFAKSDSVMEAHGKFPYLSAGPLFDILETSFIVIFADA